MWSLDFNNVLLEIKLDSQVCCMAVWNAQQVLCGCLNGTLGILNRQLRLFSFLVRSHSEPVISLRYHSILEKLVTISQDYTIRIWKLRQKKCSNNQ